jgi:mRNA interferase MazF
VIEEGQIVLFTFPQADQAIGAVRPALLLRRLPGPHEDWLVCMISTRLHQRVPELDEVIACADPEFQATGLKLASVIRVSRLAVVAEQVFHGAIGRLTPERLHRIRVRLAGWIQGIVAAQP